MYIQYRYSERDEGTMNKMIDENRYIADAMLQLRKKHHLSQEEFANKLGVTRQAISRWEMGLSVPNIKMFIKIREIFDVSIDEILNHPIELEEKNLIFNNRKNQSLKTKYIKIGNILIIFGFVFFFTLPFLAEAKKYKDMETFYSAYEHSYKYITEYPLLIVLFLAVLFIIIGFYLKGGKKKNEKKNN